MVTNKDQNSYRYKKVLALIKEKIPEYKSLNVLDVGVGNGTLEFAKVFNTIHAVDVDEEKLKNICGTNIEYTLTSGNKLPFKDDAFDLVSCISTLDHIPNPLKAYRELCRVSKKYVLIGQGNNMLSLHLQKYFAPLTTTKPKDHLGHMCWIPFWKLNKISKKEGLKLLDTVYWGIGLSSFGRKLPSISINISRFYFVLYKK
ncbi:methyltransferase domain-containing protein [archaeon]|nr:methyltransferase domain-containing protein [archaeon]